MIYFDNAATTRVCGEAAQAALSAMTEGFGNPSSGHAPGRAAKDELKKARAQIAHDIGAAKPAEIVFTSCGSESDNWAIIAGAEKNRRVGRHIISSEVEHDAVLKTLEKLEHSGWEITRLPPEKDGSVSAERLASALRPDTALVSLMMVNNETGAVTDIAGVARAIKAAKCPALLHTDAVQGYMKLPFSAKALGADMISISGHKIHAPKGIGALYIRDGLKLSPMILGGGQEEGLRSGTEPMPQICAFAAASAAAAAAMPEANEKMMMIRQRIIDRVTAEIPGSVIIGGGSAHILCLSLPGYRSEVLLNYLDSRGICISRGSACKRGRRSHVLTAMGLSPRVIDGAVRLSFSRENTPEEAEIFCDELAAAAKTLFPAL